MSIYLQDIPLDEALRRFSQALAGAGLDGILGTEHIPLDEKAAGRILAGPVWAKISSPHYHASAMDGFAVRSSATAGAQPSRPLVLKVPSEAAYVDTGDPLPAWADAVLPVEIVEPVLDPDGAIHEAPHQGGQASPNLRRPPFIRIRAACPPWSHVRPLGEDMVATELVLPAGHKLRPVDLGALAGSGQVDVEVARQPVVSILPTGTELVPIGHVPQPGQIIEYNSLVLAAQVEAWGGSVVRLPICPDRFEEIRSYIAAAAESSDLVLLNAGSSAGEEDFSAEVIASLGQVLVHGVAVRPGHPVILGMIQRKDGAKIPAIGVPGYPVSAALTGEIFIEPLLTRWLGKPPFEPQVVQAFLTRKVTSPPGDDDYLRVALGRVNGRLLAAPISRGAGVITSLVRADGIAILPRGVQGLESGAAVDVRLYRSPVEIERTLLAIGSHDLTLDLLAQFLAGRGRRLASVNAGSLGGLMALRRGEAHFAGAHLMDESSGVYNLAAIRQYLVDIPVRLVGWVGRSQGLLVLPGDPLNIRTIRDLKRPGIRFINRQRGAGTRILLDYAMRIDNITPAEIQGYDQEEYTHTAVAAAVSSGRADCGLGIAAAAAALHLDFIPLFSEEYQLVVPAEVYDSPLFQPVLDLARDPAFRAAVAALPGYDVTHMGVPAASLP